MRTRLTIALLIFALLPSAASALPKGPARLNLGQRYRFVFMSDCRSGDRMYKKIVAALVKREPDFVVYGGDILPTFCNEKQWANFERLSSPIKVPFYLAPGNHDIEDERSDRFWASHMNLPGNERYYSFTVGDDLFVVLNSADYRNDRKITGAQFAWLARTLDPDRYEHQFVFVHHPMFMWKGAFHEKESLERHPKERDRLHRLLAEKEVDIVFHGHEHGYRRMDRDGVRYVIAAGAGSPLYHAFHNFAVIDVNGSMIEVKIIDDKGVLRDEFTRGTIPTMGREAAKGDD